METIFFQNGAGSVRSAGSGIRRFEPFAGMVAVHLRMERGMPWVRDVENFDTMALFLEVIEGEVRLSWPGGGDSFVSGDSAILGATVSPVSLELPRREPVEIYALFVADFFLSSFLDGDEGSPANRLYDRLSRLTGIEVFQNRPGSAISLSELEGLVALRRHAPLYALATAVTHLEWFRRRLMLFGPEGSKRYARIVKEATEFAEAALPETLSIARLARMCGVGEATLKRAFWRIEGESVARSLRRRRLIKARSLLESGLGVAEAARLCGFTHRGHFSRLFREEFGVTPSVLRK